MSDNPQREMTLDEWIQRLPESHRARRRYEAMMEVVEAADKVSEGECRGEVAKALIWKLDDALEDLSATDGD